MKFTDKQIKALKPEPQRYELYSKGEDGLGIRVTPKGVKTWITRYRDRATRKHIRITLGVYGDPEHGFLSLSDARKRHIENRALLLEGQDPRALKQTEKKKNLEAETVEAFIDEFEKHYRPKRKDGRPPSETYVKENVRILRKDAVSAWGKLKVKDITKRQIIALLDEVKERGPIAANSLHARLSMFFRFAVKRGVIELNPFTEIDKPADSRKRDRWLDKDEIKIVWNALDTCPVHDNIKQGLRLLLLTGQRRSEVALAPKSEFNLEKKEWIIPSTRTKNGETHLVPLSEPVFEIIQDLFFKYPDSKWLLPSNYGLAYKKADKDTTRDDLPFSERALSRAVRNNADKFKHEDGTAIPHWTPHDLRRTAATIMTSECKVDRFIVRKVLNHKEPKHMQITEVYDQYEYENEKREALDKLALKLEEIIKNDD
ncbi:MAG: tyrosine-type recombinase/integrase [Gammaproteobacteria bacterium]|nr:tyrosine-type recombinase/integrase [Gammaproteobacteria bacterium]